MLIPIGIISTHLCIGSLLATSDGLNYRPVIKSDKLCKKRTMSFIRNQLRNDNLQNNVFIFKYS